MKNFKIAFAIAATLLAFPIGRAAASTLPYQNLVNLCVAGNEANQMGLSVKPMLKQILADRGQPTYLVNTIMGEMRPVCPRVF